MGVANVLLVVIGIVSLGRIPFYRRRRKMSALDRILIVVNDIGTLSFHGAELRWGLVKEEGRENGI